jgi:hypothetical protein
MDQDIRSASVPKASMRLHHLLCGTRDSAAGTGQGYRLHDRGSEVRFQAGVKDVSLLPHIKTCFGPTQTSLQGVGVPRTLSTGATWMSGRETNGSPTTNIEEYVEVTFTHPYVFIA